MSSAPKDGTERRKQGPRSEDIALDRRGVGRFERREGTERRARQITRDRGTWSRAEVGDDTPRSGTDRRTQGSTPSVAVGGSNAVRAPRAGGTPPGAETLVGIVGRLNALHARMVKAHASNEDLLTVLAAIDEVLAQRQRAEESERVFTKLCDTLREGARR